MMKRALPVLMLLTGLGCQTLPQGLKLTPVAPDTRGGSAAPKARPSDLAPLTRASGPAPAARASAAAPTARPSGPVALGSRPPIAGGAGTGALALPTRVTPQLPASLRAVTGLVGADGASLVGADGGTMVAAGAGNLVAAGGLNYALLQTKALPLPEVIRGQLLIYLVTSLVTEQILLAAAAASLQPGATLTFRDDGNPELTAAEKDRPENHLTLRLLPVGDHGVVEVFRGTEPDPARQIAGVSFTSPTQGRVLLRDLAPKKDGTQNWVASTFDLEAGRSSADLYSEGPGPARARLHISFTADPGAGENQPAFMVRTTGYGKNPAKKEDGVLALSVNFRDEGAAAIVGFLPAEFKAMLGENLVFLPSDGSEPNPANSAPHALFLDAAGRDLAPASAPAALKAIVPADTDVEKPYMTDPTLPVERAPLQEAVFKFPE